MIITKPLISVVIPCLNEDLTIGDIVKKILKVSKESNIKVEVVVVDNCSVDQTSVVAKKAGAKVVFCSERGYGKALDKGFRSASGEYLLMGDADGSYDFSYLPKFVENIKDNDIVIGSRLKGEIAPGAMPFLHRYLGTPVLTALINIFFKAGISDCNSGMRLIKKKSYLNLEMESGGMEFASEMLIKAAILGYKISEFPIAYHKDLRKRKPHLKTWTDGWRHLKFILLYAPKHLFILPGIVSYILGTLLVFMQAFGPFRWGAIYMDFQFMILGLSLSILGVYITQMGLIIQLYSSQSKFYNKSKFINIIRNLSLEKVLISGLFANLLGLLFFLDLLWQWINNGFINVFQPRLPIMGLYFIFIGITLIFFSFFKVVMSHEKIDVGR